MGQNYQLLFMVQMLLLFFPAKKLKRGLLASGPTCKSLGNCHPQTPNQRKADQSEKQHLSPVPTEDQGKLSPSKLGKQGNPGDQSFLCVEATSRAGWKHLKGN